MAIIYIVELGHEEYNSTDTSSRTVTLDAGAGIGDLVVLFIANNGSRSVASVSDSKGNTYTLQHALALGTMMSCALAYSFPTVALVSGDTYTVNWPGTGSTRLTAMHAWSGVENQAHEQFKRDQN